MQKQNQGKSGKRNGNAPVVVRVTGARAKYKGSSKPAERKLRNLMDHCGLTRAQALEVQRGAPIPKTRVSVPKPVPVAAPQLPQHGWDAASARRWATPVAVVPVPVVLVSEVEAPFDFAAYIGGSTKLGK